MEHTGYFVKFNNFAMHPSGTGKLHIDVLSKHSQVIWGQWRAGANLLNENIYKEMNSIAPFDFYALDKNGKIPGHIFTDYSSPETIFESLTLPKLDSSIRIFPVNTQGVTKGEAVLDLTPVLLQYANKEICYFI